MKKDIMKYNIIFIGKYTNTMGNWTVKKCYKHQREKIKEVKKVAILWTLLSKLIEKQIKMDQIN